MTLTSSAFLFSEFRLGDRVFFFLEIRDLLSPDQLSSKQESLPKM